MSPETKTVLGRVFTWNDFEDHWECNTTYGQLQLWGCSQGEVLGFGAALISPGEWTLAEAFGPTESDAILALQATLRKMAELEVQGG